ncbi:hypothetical protein PTKIN_Ptkin04bG0053100 [Pterospermum kingtungense]
MKAHLSVGTDAIFPGHQISGNQRLTSQGGVFELGFFTPEYGSLVILNSSKMGIWSANVMHNSTIAMILDNGNFVLCKRMDPSNIVWQSFDYPTDTWLPGAKLGFNTYLRPWKYLDDPAPGWYSATAELDKKWQKIRYDSMYWKILDLKQGKFSKQLMPFRDEHFNMLNLKPTFCDRFSVYNKNGEPVCVCLKGFTPNMSQLEDRSHRCIRRTPLGCESGREDRFIVVHDIGYAAIDNTPPAEGLRVENIRECELACLRNCSCIGYAHDVLCLIWKGYLPHLHQFSPDERVIGTNFYVLVAASEVTKAKAKRKATGITTSIVIEAILVVFTLLCIGFRKMKNRKNYTELDAVGGSLVIFKYRDLRMATKKFSEKLGEGGFGLVFRGTLPNSTAIAVKQLKVPGGSEKQFIAEVKTIEKIQHINVVSLRGFCAEASKRFLVYDYMPNGSLASLLLQNRDEFLNWRTIYHIAVGTARGIAYLHEKYIDCIIHCDIKPENVLLDAEYNPKVADFGLAKLLGRNFSRVLTTMRGTRGYLAPEWMSGLPISSTVDVYSYGKLLFEVVSRKRNMDTVDSNSICNYFPYRVADALSREEDILTLLNYSLEDKSNIKEHIRVCKVACWCIQDDDKDRPSMGQVVQMLEGFIEVDTPPIPGYFQSLKDDTVNGTSYQETSTSSNMSS